MPSPLCKNLPLSFGEVAARPAPKSGVRPLRTASAAHDEASQESQGTCRLLGDACETDHCGGTPAMSRAMWRRKPRRPMAKPSSVRLGVSGVGEAFEAHRLVRRESQWRVERERLGPDRRFLFRAYASSTRLHACDKYFFGVRATQVSRRCNWRSLFRQARGLQLGGPHSAAPQCRPSLPSARLGMTKRDGGRDSSAGAG